MTFLIVKWDNRFGIPRHWVVSALFRNNGEEASAIHQ